MELTRQVQSISQKVDMYEKKIIELEVKVNQHKDEIAIMKQKADGDEEHIGKVDKYISKLIPWTHEVSQSIALLGGGGGGGSSLEGG